MTRKTLLLISPPVMYAKRWCGNWIANKPHLASLSGYVRDLADVRILELEFTKTDDGTAQLLLDKELCESVDLVGISCWTSMHYLGTIAVAERVRHLSPDIPIVIGGHHPTARPNDFTHAVCDWVVRGDGEHVLRDLCMEWPERPAEMQIVSGRLFDQSNPDHVDWEQYGRPGKKDRVLWVGISRGCSFQCRYCVEPQRSASYSRYSVNDTLQIVERLFQQNEPDVIAFSDPLFGAGRRWIEAFLDGLRKRTLPLMFWAQTRADLMTPDLLESFKQCGFMLDFGMDTASKSMIKRMEKAADPDRYLAKYMEVLEYADAIGLLHGVYLIFNFPGETPETVRETQDFIDRLGQKGAPMSGWLSAQTFFILPGTYAFDRIAEHAASFGTEIRHPFWWKEVGDQYVMATDILPSSAWIDRPDALYAFHQWNDEVNARWISRYPAEVQQFREAIYTGSTRPATSAR
jgi:anaerobic magnesium-protoporphyrin IX monomethyl ester cyclase